MILNEKHAKYFLMSLLGRIMDTRCKFGMSNHFIEKCCM